MPARDGCEAQVIRAFEKEAWKVVATQYPIELDNGSFVLADLRLSRASEQVLVIEVKCFSRPGAILAEFYNAVGQYVFYRTALRLNHVDEVLYLAIPQHIYQGFFQQRIVQTIIHDLAIKLAIVDIYREELIEWQT
jgi:hypothetical protein